MARFWMTPRYTWTKSFLFLKISSLKCTPPPATRASAPRRRSKRYGLLVSERCKSLCIDSSPKRSTADEVILSLAGYLPVRVPRLSLIGTGMMAMLSRILSTSLSR
ncbi:MAG: hypothetical protein ACD_55C00131G0002 [uncultured bacterium]|nr:MAG: hypothetical protein ACD_55C00131G0002 [uncultured bacterium]